MKQCTARSLLVLLLLLVSAPAPTRGETQTATTSPQEAWWQSLLDLCDQAYRGRLVSDDSADAALAAEAMTMHVRRCTPERIEVPFHIGDNRSRTWVLTRSEHGIQLQHDHRHEDGSADAVTFYGGHTAAAGTGQRQDFPVDAFSKELFTRHGLDASTVNVWRMEIVAGERFSYILERPGRFFRADFDLRAPVPIPPPPWGATR